MSVSADTSIGDITLGSGYLVSGRVVPPSGSIDYFVGSVGVIPASGKLAAQVNAVIGDDDDSTKYIMAIPAGRHTLTVSGVQAFSPSSQMLPASSSTTSPLNVKRDVVRNVRLARGFSFTCTFKDSAGRPLTGVLYVRRSATDPLITGQATAIIVVNGLFVSNLPAGTYDLVFVPLMANSYSGRATRTVLALTMPSSATTKDYVAQDGIVLTGKITEPGGNVSPNALIELSKSGTDTDSLDAIPQPAIADAKGRYRLTVPVGTYDVHAVPVSVLESAARRFRRSIGWIR